MRVLIVPGTLALLPEYAGADDPILELRAAVGAGVAWLVQDSPGLVGTVAVWGDPLTAVEKNRGLVDPACLRIARALLPGARWVTGAAISDSLLIVANGSAKRTEKAPGHFDERSADFDAVIEAALAAGDPAALGLIDQELGDQLWATGLRALSGLAKLAITRAQLRYAGDPYGVRYWVVSLEAAP